MGVHLHDGELNPGGLGDDTIHLADPRLGVGYAHVCISCHIVRGRVLPHLGPRGVTSEADAKIPC